VGSAQSRGAEGSPRGGCSSSLGVDGQCRALLCVAATEFDRTAWNCVSGGLGLSLGRFSSPGGGQALEQASWGSGCSITPDGVQAAFE